MYIIHYLDIEKIFGPLLKKEYRSIYYPYYALIKLILFMRIFGIKDQSKMERYLNKHPRVKKKLGLKRVPTQSMISRFLNHYLTEEIKEKINYISEKIIKIAKEFNLDLDIKQEKTRKRLCESSTLYRLDCEMISAIRMLKKLIIDCQLIKIRGNSVYKLREYLDLLMEMMLKHTYAETGSRSFRRDKIKEKKFIVCSVCSQSLLYRLSDEIKKDWALNYLYCPKCGYRERISPSGDMLRKHIATKFESIEQLMKHFDFLFENIWIRTKRYNLFGKPVNIHIDRTEIPYYGDINDVGVHGKKPEAGTSWGFIFYTVCISKFGRRYTLYTLPLIKHKKNIPESLYLYHQNIILEQLLLYAKQKVKINYVLFDNAFSTDATFTLMDELGLKYLTPIKGEKGRQQKIIDDTKELPSHSVIHDYKFVNSTITVFLVRKKVPLENKPWEKKEVIFRYATNVKQTGDRFKWVDDMVALYRKRMGIETIYRKDKDDFFPKAQTKKYIIRLFYFELVVLFYNLWVFANILVCFSLYDEVQNDPIVHARDFLDEMYDQDPAS